MTATSGRTEVDRFHVGSCACGSLRYEMRGPPLIVHCCHCVYCQRETGSAFALNALIESQRVRIVHGGVELILTPSESGRGQKIARCPCCRVAVWSHYAGAGDAVCFVRVGTLERPGALPPDVHIYTESKQRWFELPAGARAVPTYYRKRDVWSRESLERLGLESR